MQERRKFKRRYLMYYSRIFDKTKGSVLGYIVDLTPEGAMILSEQPVDVGQRFDFRMDLPEGIANKDFLDFQAESRWCSRDIDPNFWDTGLYLFNITEEDRSIIDKMIQEYGFREI